MIFMRTIIIVDQMIEYIDEIKDMILTMKEKFNIVHYTHIPTFLQELNNYPEYSIFIINILLINANGIDLAQTIIQAIKGSQIIFVSDSLEKATEVYEVDHCYFIYKPQLAYRLPFAIHKALEIIHQAQKSISLILKDRILVVQCGDIVYVERSRRYTYIHCLHETIKTSLMIYEVYKKLPDEFVRCHHNYIVNMYYIKEYEKDKFYLMNDLIIPISRSYHLTVREQFHQYLIKT